MGTPAVQLKDMPGLPVQATPGPVAGEFGFTPFVSLAGPISQGAPPVTPSLVRQVTSSARRREMRTAGGDLCVRPLTKDASEPLSVRVEWGNLTNAQRVTLVDWMRDVIFGGRYAFTVKLDGADSDQSINVRPTQDWEAVREGLKQAVAGVVCEEVR
jgi:hypothetical protein